VCFDHCGIHERFDPGHAPMVTHPRRGFIDSV
jgi:hypothetical protein